LTAVRRNRAHHNLPALTPPHSTVAQCGANVADPHHSLWRRCRGKGQCRSSGLIPSPTSSIIDAPRRTALRQKPRGSAGIRFGVAIILRTQTSPRAWRATATYTQGCCWRMFWGRTLAPASPRRSCIVGAGAPDKRDHGLVEFRALMGGRRKPFRFRDGAPRTNGKDQCAARTTAELGSACGRIGKFRAFYIAVLLAAGIRGGAFDEPQGCRAQPLRHIAGHDEGWSKARTS
jgi:hypothetical protein